MNSGRIGTATPGGRVGFTLIEVVLAVAITVGVLGVVLYFYKQASHLRVEMLAEAEAIAAARLVMDRLTTELRCAGAYDSQEKALVGKNDSIAFTAALLPRIDSWDEEETATLGLPQTDVARLRYSLAGSGANASGLQRLQEPLFHIQPEPIEESSETEFALETEEEEEERPAADGGELLLTEHLRYIRFRYWSGTGWQDQWNHWRLPKGVEVTLGREPLPPDVEPADYPHEMFRRVIYLPGSEAENEEIGWLDFFEEDEFEEEPG